MKIKKTYPKPTKFSEILAIINDKSKRILFLKIFRIKYKSLEFLFFIEVKFGRRKRGSKKIDISRDEMFRMKCGAHTLLNTKTMKKFWKG
jgi:hypothetical protein